jgi:hypothetical protein
MVPETYVWDGVEYVGVVGDQYFYLGPGDVWLVCEPFRMERFHGWERDHRDWREHAIRNDRFRRDARGHEQPRNREQLNRGEQPRHDAPAMKAAPAKNVAPVKKAAPAKNVTPVKKAAPPAKAAPAKNMAPVKKAAPAKAAAQKKDEKDAH